MIKLLKNLRRREKLMALVCLVFVVCQVYFDLRLPDYMTELTVLIKTSGTTADIVNIGLKMLGCTAVSALLAVACGYFASKTGRVRRWSPSRARRPRRARRRSGRSGGPP